VSTDGTRAYVAAYLESAIDVVDTNPVSAKFGEVITTIANDDYDPDR
jgi:DNA-binding beta-propeller fold protein YncE